MYFEGERVTISENAREYIVGRKKKVYYVSDTASCLPNLFSSLVIEPQLCHDGNVVLKNTFLDSFAARAGHMSHFVQ